MDFSCLWEFLEYLKNIFLVVHTWQPCSVVQELPNKHRTSIVHELHTKIRLLLGKQLRIPLYVTSDERGKRVLGEQTSLAKHTNVRKRNAAAS